MITLRIYSDIQSEEEKTFTRMFGGVEGVSFDDIDTFCNSIPEDEDEIDIRLHCNGGSVLEGWAIYDRLRATGKTITATVEGHAASMATIILLAAPKGNRRAYPDAQLCIHNPYIWTGAIGATATADELQKVSGELKRDQERLLSLYVERTGADRDELQALMDEDTFIDMEKAQALGFIDTIIPHASAYKSNPNKNMKMSKMLKKVFGKQQETEQEAYSMELNTADGGTLTVEREDGAPEVGDKASPDGEHVMPDGTTIVVTNGVIEEIRPAENSDHAEEVVDEEKGEETETEVNEEVAALEAENEQLKAENERLKAEVETLKEQLEASQAQAKTQEDMRILNAVKMAGGEKALAAFASNAKPSPRAVTKNAAEASLSVSELRERIKSINKKNKE